MLKPFLKYELHCTHFMHLVEELVLEHLCNGQLDHLDKYNLCSCTSDSVWIILPTRIREIHQVILSFNTSLSQWVRYWCIIHICVIFQAQSIIFPNLYQCGKIDHGTDVSGPVSQSSAESEYNSAFTSGMALAHFRMLIHESLN